MDYATGLAAVDEIEALRPADSTMAQFALKWILMHDGVSTAIPGAKNPDQAVANAAASDLPLLDAQTMEGVADIYRSSIQPQVHARW